MSDGRLIYSNPLEMVVFDIVRNRVGFNSEFQFYHIYSIPDAIGKGIFPLMTANMSSIQFDDKVTIAFIDIYIIYKLPPKIVCFEGDDELTPALVQLITQEQVASESQKYTMVLYEIGQTLYGTRKDARGRPYFNFNKAFENQFAEIRYFTSFRDSKIDLIDNRDFEEVLKTTDLGVLFGRIGIRAKGEKLIEPKLAPTEICPTVYGGGSNVFVNPSQDATQIIQSAGLKAIDPNNVFRDPNKPY